MARPFAKTPILITGATGYIGEHLARHLALGNRSIVGIGYRRSLAVPWILQLDMRQAGALNQCLGDLRPDVVFHCAAETDAAFCQCHGDVARGHIIDSTCNLVKAVARYSPGAVVVALSTDLVFDGEHAPYREGDPAQPLNIYGRLKLEAEDHILSLDRGIVLRTSLVYGKRATYKGSFLAWMVDTLARGQPLRLFQDEVRTPIFVQDLCAAMIAVADCGQGGLWHAGGLQRLNRVAMGRMVCSAFGFNQNLIRSMCLADSTYPAPRARDVSLDSRRLWSLLRKKPGTFDQVLKRIAQKG